MIDYSKAFHTGVLTPDLDAAMAFYSRTLGLTFAEPQQLSDFPVWTPATGLVHVEDRFTYSIDGPMHLELQCGTPGSIFDPALSRGDHIGFWVSDLPRSVADLTAGGWKLTGAGGRPEDGYGPFAYLEPVAGGMAIELVSDALQPVFTRWWNGEGLTV